jgi:hypothetical protein
MCAWFALPVLAQSDNSIEPPDFIERNWWKVLINLILFAICFAHYEEERLNQGCFFLVIAIIGLIYTLIY